MSLKFHTFLATLTNLTISVSTIFFLDQPAIAAGSKFFCGTGTTKSRVTVPATIVRTVSGEEIPIILWVSNYFSTSGFTPQNRCEQASKQFQRYYDGGWLQYIRTDVFNELGVLCIARSTQGKCLSSDIIVSLPPGTDRFDALAQLLDLNRLASGRPLYLTDDLIIYRNGEAFINVEILIKRSADN